MSEGQIVVEDTQKMLEKIMDLPNQLEKGWTTNWTKNLPMKAGDFDNVIICGMGASGVVGRLLVDLYGGSVSVPIVTWADYGLPGWANNRTLLIVVSYSGDTEEELDNIRVALERKMSIVAISSGGKVAKSAEIHAYPILQFNYDSQPRAAIGYQFGSLLTLVTKLGLITLTEKSYFQAVEELQKTIAQKHFPNKAEDLAVTLNNKVPLILAYSPLAAVASRYRSQLNENSKTFALSAALPEASHNIIVGTEFAVPEKLQVLILESKYGFSRNAAHKNPLEKVFNQRDIPLVPLSVKSGSALAEQLLFIHFGDLLSYYLAGVYGVDPTPVEAIETLKSEMAKL